LSLKAVPQSSSDVEWTVDGGGGKLGSAHSGVQCLAAQTPSRPLTISSCTRLLWLNSKQLRAVAALSSNRWASTVDTRLYQLWWSPALADHCTQLKAVICLQHVQVCSDKTDATVWKHAVKCWCVCVGACRSARPPADCAGCRMNTECHNFNHVGIRLQWAWIIGILVTRQQTKATKAGSGQHGMKHAAAVLMHLQVTRDKATIWQKPHFRSRIARDGLLIQSHALSAYALCAHSPCSLPPPSAAACRCLRALYGAVCRR